MMQTAFFLFLSGIAEVLSECLPSSSRLEEIFQEINGVDSIPIEGSCCMTDVCGLPCPEPVSPPGNGFAIAVGIAIGLSFIIGMLTYFMVAGQAENFFVAGRSLPLFVVAMTLAAQSVDSNALLGNADLSYKYHYFDGAVLPIGLGLSLILNGIFLAHHINNDNALTLPDVFAKRYGRTVEILVSLATIVSFLCLLAGNLVGMGAIVSYIWGIGETPAVWISAGIVWAYTATGGLFSVAYTDVAQGAVGWIGCMVCAFYLIANEDPNAPPPSVGFPTYVYPDNIGDEGICDMYQGVECQEVEGACCYNEEVGLPTDNGAYPFGDQRIFSDQMTNPYALTPFPNAIFWNWATIFILGFGNLAALDFQARCMAAKTANTARLGCLIGGCITFLVGIPFAYLGSITRVYYGPDSVHAQFDPDTCSDILGLPTCGAWMPDPLAFIKLLTHQAPAWIGAWGLIGIVAASMSTADGAILAMGTVFSHNIVRQFDTYIPSLVTDDNLLLVSRVATIPFAVIASAIAAFYRSSHSAGATGYLLIVAFDIVLATVVVPLFGCFYSPSPSPRAALVSVLVGATFRIVLEFALSKDGFLLLPFGQDEFLNYGPAASDAVPVFFDSNATWNSTAEPCEQERFSDFTGVDSLSAFFASLLVYVLITLVEGGSSLFSFPGDQPYDKMEKEIGEGELVKNFPEREEEAPAEAEEVET